MTGSEPLNINTENPSYHVVKYKRNAQNVIPYGKFAHEVAQKGGPDAYKAAMEVVKEATFNSGMERGRKQMLPWVIASSAITLAVTVREGIRYYKHKKTEKLRIAEEARKAEKFLTNSKSEDADNSKEDK